MVALEAKYRLERELKVQELHDQLANLQVTAADKYDSARAIQGVRRNCVGLGALGDVVVPTRKTHSFFRAPPEEDCESLKTVLSCDRQRDGSTSNVERIARETSYDVLNNRGKVTAINERAGRDEQYAGSNERALNTTAREKPRSSRRNSGRGQGGG